MTDPIQSEHRQLMNLLAHAIDEALNGPRKIGVPPRIGFVLLVSEFGKMEGGKVNYVSNGERKNMLTMCREYLARAEGRYQEPVDTGRAN